MSMSDEESCRAFFHGFHYGDIRHYAMMHYYCFIFSTLLLITLPAICLPLMLLCCWYYYDAAAFTRHDDATLLPLLLLPHYAIKATCAIDITPHWYDDANILSLFSLFITYFSLCHAAIIAIRLFHAVSRAERHYAIITRRDISFTPSHAICADGSDICRYVAIAFAGW